MSLGDHLRFLRALADVEPAEIAAAQVIDSLSSLAMAEVRYRPVEEDALIQKLADFYDRPVAEFHWHNARARKYLTFYVDRALRTGEPVQLTLRGGEVLHGRLEWWDLGSIGLRDGEDRLLVVQRHAVIDWPEASVHWWVEEVS
jgi:hypothetical protein